MECQSKWCERKQMLLKTILSQYQPLEVTFHTRIQVMFQYQMSFFFATNHFLIFESDQLN